MLLNEGCSVLSWNPWFFFQANEDIYGFDNTFFDIPNDEAQLGAWVVP